QGWRFSRGFVEEVTATARSFFTRPQAIFDALPLRHLKLHGHRLSVRKMLACRYLERLCYFNRISVADLRSIVSSPNLAWLEVLSCRWQRGRCRGCPDLGRIAVAASTDATRSRMFSD